MTGRFQTRPTRPTGTTAVNGWRLKTYEITLDGAAVGGDVVSAVGHLLGDGLPAPTTDDVGFLIVHHGAEQVWVLADLWSGDIICQHTFCADLDAPTEFRRVPAGGPTACVWELAVHAHERDAFIRHVLDPAGGPDAEAYLADTLTID
ncbi:MAG: hypothetical protein AAGE98_13615 [Actinomycetota bacterium]